MERRRGVLIPGLGLVAGLAGATVGTSLLNTAHRTIRPLGPGSLSLAAGSLWLGLAGGLAVWLLAAAWVRWLGPVAWGEALRRASGVVAPLGGLLLLLGEDCLFLAGATDVLLLASLLGALWRFGSEGVRAASCPGSRASRWHLRWAGWSPRRWALLVGIVGLALGTAYGCGLFGHRRTLVGDEPSYVTIAHSLAFDGDVSMADDYRDREYRRWVSGEYPMFAHPGKDGRMYPHHGIGLPLYLAPFLRLGQELPDRGLVALVRCAMSFLFGLLLAQTFLLALTLTGDRRAALLYTAVLGSTAPLLFYSTEVYPETAAALILVWGVRQALALAERPFRRGLALGIGAAILPWLGAKYLPAAVALILLGIWRARSPGARLRGVLSILLPGLLGGGLFLAFLYRLYGVFSPRAIYHGVAHPLPPGGGLQEVARVLAQPLETLSVVGTFLQGVLLEQRVGLLIWAPVFFFLLPEAIRRIRVRPSLLLPMAPGLVHLLFYAYSNNWGGYCAPNRPLIAAFPLLGLPLAWAFLRPGGRRRRTALVAAWGVSLLWSWTFLTHDRWLYHTMNPHLTGGEAIPLAKLSMPFGPRWSRLFPLVMGPEKASRVNAVWTLGLAILVALDLWVGRPHRRTSISLRGAVAPVAAAVLLAVLVWRAWALPGDRFRFDFPGPPEHGIYVWDTGLYGPELGGFWVARDRDARGWMELREVPEAWTAWTHSLVENRVTFVLGGEEREILYPAGRQLEVELTPECVFRRGALRYLKLRARAERGRVPSETRGGSDGRDLGAFFRLEGRKAAREEP